jgi:Outer membrane protein beta-barrel domain
MGSRAGSGVALLALLLAVAPLFAQDQADSSGTRVRRRRPAVGAMAGYSRSDLVGPDAQQLQGRQGSVTGVFLLAPITGPLSFRPELLFSLKGGRTATETGLLDIELAYLELPLNAKITMSRGRVRPVLFAGPVPAFQIGCDFQFITSQVSTRSTCGEAEFSLFRTFDLGFVAGAGVEFHWPSSDLALEGRYTAGVRSILDEAEVRNRAFGLVLALTF